MAGVPDTNTFSLQDVVDVLPGSQNSLQDCFDDAIDDFFDPTYKGSKNSLYNFRNYGGSVEMWFEYGIGSAAGYVDHNNASWATVRGATTGSNAYTSGDWEVYVDYTGGVYYINRAFMRFDLSIIPATATCEEAGIGFDAVTTYGSSIYPVGLEGTQGATIGTDDFDAFTFSDYLFSDYTVGPGVPFDAWGYSLESTGSTQLGQVEAAFGDYLYLAIINGYYDNGNNAPSNKQGMRIFRSGEILVPPELRIVFTI